MLECMSLSVMLNKLVLDSCSDNSERTFNHTDFLTLSGWPHFCPFLSCRIQQLAPPTVCAYESAQEGERKYEAPMSLLQPQQKS